MRHRIPAEVWVLRVVIALGPLVALYAAVPSGFVPSPFVAAVVVLLSVGFAFRPEQYVGLVALGVVLVWWALIVGTAVPVGSLLAAAALLASHVAATLLGYGPAETPVGSDLSLLWVARGAAVWLAALVVFLTARGYDGHATPPLFWLVGLAAALVGAVVAAVVVPAQGRRR